MTTASRAAAGLLAAGALVAAVVVARGERPAGAPATAPRGAPRIEVEPRRFDFGNVLPRKTLHKELAVRNHGDAVLRITNVATTCNCAVVGSYTNVLEPGMGTRLRVSLTAPDTPGLTVQAVRIESNDPDQPRVDVEVGATVIAPPKR